MVVGTGWYGEWGGGELIGVCLIALITNNNPDNLHNPKGPTNPINNPDPIIILFILTPLIIDIITIMSPIISPIIQ